MRFINKQSDSIIKAFLNHGTLLFEDQFQAINKEYSCFKEFSIKTMKEYNAVLDGIRNGEILAFDFTNPEWFKECFVSFVGR